MSEPVHEWFGLTYANYLVLPRSLLQSMPDDWQERFVGCLEELHTRYGDRYEPAGGYRVRAVDERGKFTHDPAPHYDRGRAYAEPRHE